MCNKCNELEKFPNHLPSQSVEKVSSIKLLPGAKWEPGMACRVLTCLPGGLGSIQLQDLLQGLFVILPLIFSFFQQFRVWFDLPEREWESSERVASTSIIPLSDYKSSPCSSQRIWKNLKTNQKKASILPHLAVIIIEMFWWLSLPSLTFSFLFTDF